MMKTMIEKDEAPERSQAVCILSDMVSDIMRKIKDADWVEKQQKMMLQFFQFLGKVKSLEDAAQKLLAVAMKEDSKKSKEDSEEDSEEDLYFV